MTLTKAVTRTLSYKAVFTMVGRGDHYSHFSLKSAYRYVIVMVQRREVSFDSRFTDQCKVMSFLGRDGSALGTIPS